MYSMVLMAALQAGADTPAWFWKKKHCIEDLCGPTCDTVVNHTYKIPAHKRTFFYSETIPNFPQCGCIGFGPMGQMGQQGFGGGFQGQTPMMGGFGQGGGFGGNHGFNNFGGGCFGCQGCFGCYGGMPNAGHSAQAVDHDAAEPILINPSTSKTKAKASANRAKLTIDLPEDAKLYVDDEEVETIDGRGAFKTPKLEKGKEYFYDLRVDVVRNGKVHSKTKKIVIRAGDEAHAAFTNVGNVMTAKR